MKLKVKIIGTVTLNYMQNWVQSNQIQYQNQELLMTPFTDQLSGLHHTLWIVLITFELFLSSSFQNIWRFVIASCFPTPICIWRPLNPRSQKNWLEIHENGIYFLCFLLMSPATATTINEYNNIKIIIRHVTSLSVTAYPFPWGCGELLLEPIPALSEGEGSW